MTRTGSTSGGTGQTDVDDPAYTAAIIGTSAEGTSNTPPLRYTRILMCLLLCHVMLCNAYAALRYVSVELQVHRA